MDCTYNSKMYNTQIVNNSESNKLKMYVQNIYNRFLMWYQYWTSNLFIFWIKRSEKLLKQFILLKNKNKQIKCTYWIFVSRTWNPNISLFKGRGLTVTEDSVSRAFYLNLTIAKKLYILYFLIY